MTSTADTTAPPPRTEDGGLPPHPVVGFVDSLSAALDQLAGAVTWSLTPDEQRSTLVALRRQLARLEELELRVLVSADRNDVGVPSGATSTATWLADATGARRADCFERVRLAHALDGDLDSTRRALAAGEIDSDRAAVVVHAVTALTDEHDDLPDDVHSAAQAHLLDLARIHDAAALRRLGKRLFEVVCPEAADVHEGRTLAAEEARARRLAFLRIRDNGDGTSDGSFRLPTLHAELLKKALSELTSPRRAGAVPTADGSRAAEGASGDVGSPDGPSADDSRRPFSSVLGVGFLELLENHLDLETLPGSSGSPFTVVVTVGLQALRTGLGVATLETGHRISAGEARRLACSAGIIPMVLSGESVPLDLGRERRFYSKHQRIALAHRYGGCATAGCDRPPSMTEVHHLDPWRAGGRTDLGRGLPLCSRHHHLADQPQQWVMTVLDDGQVRFARRG